MAANPWGRRGWTPDRLGDLTGRVYVITGANSGIGFEASKLLAGAGAKVIWLCRNPHKAAAARSQQIDAQPDADVTVVVCDLADLDSVATAADEVRRLTDRIDALICNAGIMMLPERELTTQGFEMQLGVNHMAHFALTGRLLDLIESCGGRIVSVSSGAHKAGVVDLDDLMFEQGYGSVVAYCRSKLANMLFVLEANRRLTEAGATTRAYPTHPGYSATNLQSTGPGAIATAIMKVTNLLAQSAARGSWPLVLAATDELAETSAYYGPTGLAEGRGPVGLCQIAEVARDSATARRLWEVSQDLTDVTWKFTPEEAP